MTYENFTREELIEMFSEGISNDPGQVKARAAAIAAARIGTQAGDLGDGDKDMLGDRLTGRVVSERDDHMIKHVDKNGTAHVAASVEYKDGKYHVTGSDATGAKTTVHDTHADAVKGLTDAIKANRIHRTGN